MIRKSYNLYRIVEIDTESGSARIEDLGMRTEKEVFRLIQSFLYVQYTIDQDDVRNEIMNAIHRNDVFSLRMYQELLASSFLPMSFSEMKQKYYIKNPISRYTNHELYDIWNHGVDYIFTDTHCALT